MRFKRSFTLFTVNCLLKITSSFSFRMSTFTRAHSTPLLSTETGVRGSLWEKRIWIQGRWMEMVRDINRAGRLLSSSSCPWRRTLIQLEIVLHKQVNILLQTRKYCMGIHVPSCLVILCNIWHLSHLSFPPGPSRQIEKGVCHIPSVAGILLVISVACFHPKSHATLKFDELTCPLFVVLSPWY